MLSEQKAIIRAGGTEGRTTARFATADGGWRWMSDHGRAILDDEGTSSAASTPCATSRPSIEAAVALAEREQQAQEATERAEQAERELRGVIDSLIDPWVLLRAVATTTVASWTSSTSMPTTRRVPRTSSPGTSHRAPAPEPAARARLAGLLER